MGATKLFDNAESFAAFLRGLGYEVTRYSSQLGPNRVHREYVIVHSGEYRSSVDFNDHKPRGTSFWGDAFDPAKMDALLFDWRSACVK